MIYIAYISSLLHLEILGIFLALPEATNIETTGVLATQTTICSFDSNLHSYVKSS